MGRNLMRTAVHTALDLALPRTCPGCHRPGAWCGACAATLAGRPRAVTVPEPMLDHAFRAGVAIPPIHALARYTGPARAAIIAGKERGRRDLPPLLGTAFAAALAALQDIDVLQDGLWLVPAPTRRSAARRRGGDPVLAMARAAAQRLARSGRPAGVAPCLEIGRGARDSVGLDADGRMANLAGRIRFRPTAAPPSGADVVILDDVFTSGATVMGSILALHERGIGVASCLTLAAAAPLRATHLPY